MSRARRTAAKHFVTFAVVRLAVCVVQAVPAAVTMWVADAIAWVVYRYVPARRRVALENVTAAFPDLAPAAADRLVLAMYRHFIRAAVEALLMPRKGRYGLRDYEKMFCPDLKSGHDIFTMRGIDRTQGCLVIVRPDQFVAQVLPLDAHGQLASFFDRFMTPAS